MKPVAWHLGDYPPWVVALVATNYIAALLRGLDGMMTGSKWKLSRPSQLGDILLLVALRTKYGQLEGWTQHLNGKV